MAENTSVVRSRISIDGRAYDAKPLGGGKFNVVSTTGVRVGGFVVRGRTVEIEDLRIAGSDPVERIALLWVRASLSGQEWTITSPSPTPDAPTPIASEAKPPAPALSGEPDALSAPALFVGPGAVPDVPPAAAPAEPIAPPAASAPPDPLISPAPIAPPAMTRPASEPPAPLKSLPPGPMARAAQAASQSAETEPTRGKSICRIATHARPDPAAFQKAKNYMTWLRTQPGVQAAYLTHDAQTGKTVSVTIWENRDKLASIRNASPPLGAVQLASQSVDLLWIVG